MVSVCLPSDALLQYLSSYLGFSYLGCGVSLHGCSSEVQPMLLTLDEGYLLTTALPDLQRGIASPGPPVPAQPWLLGCGVGPPGLLLLPAAPGLGCGIIPLVAALTSNAGYLLSAAPPRPRTQGSSSWPFLRPCSLALSATAPDLGRGVTPLGHRPSGMGSSWLLPLTSDVG